MKLRRPSMLSRQRGVAVITALLLTTLAITIVASLFWQQQVQVRSIENQRLQLQKQWILRGALDWTRLILREDGRLTSTDHLGEPWSVPLAETRLDQYVDNARADTDVPDAALSGGIVDAQSRFNLTNLVVGGKIDKEEVVAFAKLLSSRQLNPGLAQPTADLMASAQHKPVESPGGTPVSAPSSSGPQPMTIENVDDLLAVPGFTPEALVKLKDYIVVLPKPTPVNVNTASPEVLAASIATLSLSEASGLVVQRENAWFNTKEDFETRVGRPVDKNQIDVKSDYFLVNGNVRLNRAGLEMQALIERNGTNTKVVWIREN